MPTKTKRKKKRVFYAYAPVSGRGKIWVNWIHGVNDNFTGWREAGFTVKKVKIEVVG